MKRVIKPEGAYHWLLQVVGLYEGEPLPLPIRQKFRANA